MAKVTKAVIGAAGFGTRFLPQTKAMPKEMLPLVDKPIIQYVVEELVEAGIEDIFIHVRGNKRAIEDHFDLPNQELINNLVAGGPSKEHYIREIQDIAQLANFIFVRAKGPYGNATPILDAAHLLGDSPFIYTYADDFIVSKPKSRFKQMIDAHEKHGASILSCVRIESDSQYDRYGIIGGQQTEDGLYEMDKIVEKPGKAAAPSDLASVSSYLLDAKVIEYIVKLQGKLSQGKEFYIQPALQAMMDDGLPFLGMEIKDGTYYDTGDKLEYIKTIFDFALQREDIGPQLHDFLRKKLQ